MIPPPNEEGRLRQKMGAPRRRTLMEEVRISELAAFLGKCRQRRDDAVNRLPPLTDGRRDPLREPTDGSWCG